MAPNTHALHARASPSLGGPPCSLRASRRAAPSFPQQARRRGAPVSVEARWFTALTTALTAGKLSKPESRQLPAPPATFEDLDGDGRIRVRTVFISDVHLGTEPLSELCQTDGYNNSTTLSESHFRAGTRGCHAEELLDFLKAVKTDKLFLVGDIVRSIRDSCQSAVHRWFCVYGLLQPGSQHNAEAGRDRCHARYPSRATVF